MLRREDMNRTAEDRKRTEEDMKRRTHGDHCVIQLEEHSVGLGGQDEDGGEYEVANPQHCGWHLVWQILSLSILLKTLEAALNELNVVEGGCLKGRHPKLNSHC